jgi:broad specificity phosphatase PhoE
MAHILLIRHGPSSQATAPGLLDRAAVEQWRVTYDAAGIARGAAPPAGLIGKLARVDRIVASDLARAVASAGRLSPGRSIETTPLLREVPLPIPHLRGVRAPLALWNILITLRWGVDILRRQDCPLDVGERVGAAVEWCEERRSEAGQNATLGVVTHGVMRRLLAQRLCGIGWTMHGRRSYAPWSVWELMRIRL